ncbi:MAG: ribonuclease HII [Patescibacteria group bacterium]|nr:ribonuclease HII [Patescibacteria group bacterium]
MRKRKLSQKYIIGIDEVGRGCLAGPVTVAATLLNIRPPQGLRSCGGRKLTLRDSKKLSAKQREAWFDFIKQQKISFAVASVSPKIIDKINISQAANLAAKNAVRRLIKNSKLRIQNCKFYLDGGLYLPKSIILNSKFCILNSTTVVKGDEKIPAISFASIVAKVHRDKLMKRLHKKYPRYGFIRNVGYGTKEHIKAIRKFGSSPIHRKSFKI